MDNMLEKSLNDRSMSGLGEVILSPDDKFLEGMASQAVPHLPADILQLFSKGAFSFWQWNLTTNQLSVQGAMQADTIEEWISRIHPRDQAEFSRFLDEEAEPNSPPRIIDYRIKRHRLGKWLKVRHTAVATGDRSPILSCLVENIQATDAEQTRLHALENQFKQAEDRIHRFIRGVLQNPGAGFFDKAAKNLLVALNAESVSIFGIDYAKEEIMPLGACHLEGIAKLEIAQLDFGFVQESVRSGLLFHFPVPGSALKLSIPGDKLDHLAIHLLPSEDDGVIGLIGVQFEDSLQMRDQALSELLLSLGSTLCSAEISRLAEAKELEQTESLLRQSQKMEGVGRLSGGMIHDFNNLLAVIQGHVGILQCGMKGADLDSTMTESIETIRDASRQAAELTRQLLVFSRNQPLQFCSLDFNAVTAEFTKMLRRMVEETVDLHTRFELGIPPVFGDKAMLGQVLMNLVVNARDAMPDGGTINIRTRQVTIKPDHPKAPAPGEYICLEVDDTGSGISECDLEKIFEPFFTTKDAGRGTGIGLANVSRIVKQHDGFIEVESDQVSGSCFKVYFPTSKESDAKTIKTEAPTISRNQVSNATIFLVEDDNAVRKMVRKLLEMHGAQVFEAVSGKDALEKWPDLSDKITLVMTDIVMPDGVNGWELAQTLSKEDPHLPILLTSGYNEDPGDYEFPDSAPIKFLQKPYEIADLKSTLDLLLNYEE